MPLYYRLINKCTIMKKVIITTVCVIIAFIAGVLTVYHGFEYKYHHKIELIKAQKAALDASDKVMENNQLFDTDGSDAMVKYLDLSHKVDSLYQLEE